jgi:hypothetical protein
MQPIQLRFTYTEAEYLKAARLLTLGETKTVVRIGAFILLVLLGAIGLTIIGDFLFPVWAMILIALLVLSGTRLHDFRRLRRESTFAVTRRRAANTN